MNSTRNTVLTALGAAIFALAASTASAHPGQGGGMEGMGMHGRMGGAQQGGMGMGRMHGAMGGQQEGKGAMHGMHGQQGGKGPQQGMHGQHGAQAGGEHRHGAAGEGKGAQGAGIGQQLLSQQERDGMREKMQAARTPQERQALAAANRAEIEKRAKEKGITLPEPQGMGGHRH